MPPCAGAVTPDYPEPGSMPVVAMWQTDDMADPKALPACIGWPVEDGMRLIAVVGRFPFDGTGLDLLAQVGRVSELMETRYWSTTRQDWRPLFDDVSALSGPDLDKRRPDFDKDELLANRTAWFVQDDSDPMWPVIQRMEVIEATDDRLELAFVNENASGVLGFTALQPGNLATHLYVEREDGSNIWRYYALTRLEIALPSFVDAPDASYINRAVAMYRKFAGYPTDGDPPLAPRS